MMIEADIVVWFNGREEDVDRVTIGKKVVDGEDVTTFHIDDIEVTELVQDFEVYNAGPEATQQMSIKLEMTMDEEMFIKLLGQAQEEDGR